MIRAKKNLYASYSAGHSLDPYVVLTTANGQAQGNGYWVQPAGVDRAGDITSPVGVLFTADMLRHRHHMSCFSFFRWLIHVSTLCYP
jgi:hypothetical protein